MKSPAVMARPPVPEPLGPVGKRPPGRGRCGSRGRNFELSGVFQVAETVEPLEGKGPLPVSEILAGKPCAVGGKPWSPGKGAAAVLKFPRGRPSTRGTGEGWRLGPDVSLQAEANPAGTPCTDSWTTCWKALDRASVVSRGDQGLAYVRPGDGRGE